MFATITAKQISYFVIACAALCWLLAGIPAFAGTVYYVANGGKDAYGGTSPAFPKQHIQAGIDASIAGDTVIVADGTYTGAGNKDLDFGGRNITLRSAGGNPTLCVIDCQGTGRGFSFHSGETSTAVMSGLTIQNGRGGTLDFHGRPPEGYQGMRGGGGIIMFLSSPSIIHCNFVGNSGEWFGGGILNIGSNPVISWCTFTKNNAEQGGGIANKAAVYCCQDNKSSNPAVSNCTFNGNVAFVGGGLINDENSSAVEVNCTFVSNGAGYGGGMVNRAGNPTVVNCTFSRNYASIFANGGAVLNILSNATMTNCILWQNQSGEINPGDPSISFSCVRGGYPGEGNIDADPLFVRNPFTNGPDDYGDLHLRAGSPCIDTGSNAAVSVPPFPADSDGNPLDLDGNPRIAGGTVNMGAYEWNADVSSQVTVVRGGFRYNRATARFVQLVTLTNTGAPITGPISLVLDRLNTNVTLMGQNGTTKHHFPAGSPYINVQTGDLAAGASLTVLLEFSNPGREPIIYGARVLAGPIDR